MSFLYGLSRFFDLSTILGLNNAEGKQGGSKPQSSQRATNLASSEPSSCASSGRTSPVGSSGHSSSFSSPTQPPARPPISYVGINSPKTLKPEKFESFMENLIKAKDIEGFKKILNKHKNELTPSQMKTLQGSLIKKLESRNYRLRTTMVQLKKEYETLSQSKANLGRSFQNNSRVLTSLKIRLSKALTGNSDSRNTLNLEAGVYSYAKVDGAMRGILVEKQEKITLIKDKISGNRAIIDGNKQKIKLLNKFTGSSRISGG